jgi:hypothetical protein
MHGTTRTRPEPRPVETGVNAVVWIERGRAVVVRGSGTGEPTTVEFPIPSLMSELPAALAEVAHHIGDVDQLVVLGSGDLRIALEREIVAIGHRPDSIREEVVPGPLDEADLVGRLRRLD